jgi:geranylgeranylglycerol-phosphate geranylgeranyltransferase
MCEPTIFKFEKPLESRQSTLQPYTSPLKRTFGLVTMMRLPNCVMIGFAVIVGEAIASQAVPAQAAFYGFMTGFLLLAASMVLNDYFDREIDAINQPKRPLPAGIVKPTEAISFAIILLSIGLLFAAYSGFWTLLIASISLAIMISYNARVKKLGLLGNALVSVNVAVPFIYGGFAVGRPTWSLAIFALLAFLSSMGREILKGVVDVAGDTARGVRSIAATTGNIPAARASAILFLAAVALSALPVSLGLVSYYYMPLVAICDIGFLLTAYSVASNASPRNAKRNKNFVLVWMTFGLLAFVIGTL